MRHGLSIEMEQSIRCIDTNDAQMAMKAYSKYIEVKIAVFGDNAKTEDVLKILTTTIDTMEKAKLFGEFTGK